MVLRYDGFILDLWASFMTVCPDTVPSSVFERCWREASESFCCRTRRPRRRRRQRITESGADGALPSRYVVSEGLAAPRSRDDPFTPARPALLHIGSSATSKYGRARPRIVDTPRKHSSFSTPDRRMDDRIEDYEPLLRAALARDLRWSAPTRSRRHARQPARALRRALAKCTRSRRSRALAWQAFSLGLRHLPRLLGSRTGRDPRRRRQLRTDIAGAAGAGLDSLLIAGGIHAKEFGRSAMRRLISGESKLQFAMALITGRIAWSFCW